MTKRNSTVALVRSFKAGAKENSTLNNEFVKYEKALRLQLLSLAELSGLAGIIVITNGDNSSSLGEHYSQEGETFTTKLVKNLCPESVPVCSLVCTDWGPNPGSARALNLGVKKSLELYGTNTQVLIISKEIIMRPDIFALANERMSDDSLDVCGFYREGFWRQTQWMFPQNTAALWKMDSLKEFLFDPRCDGLPKQSIQVDDALVPIAGMEDFHAQLRMMRDGKTFAWTMVGAESPLNWNITRLNSDELQKHIQKVNRQLVVMEHWAQEIFPQQPVWKTMGMYLASAR